MRDGEWSCANESDAAPLRPSKPLPLPPLPWPHDTQPRPSKSPPAPPPRPAWLP